MSKSKPGVMLYFSFWNGLKRLDAAEKGILVDGIVGYSETGIEPEFDGTLAIIWDIAKPQIDADTERYNATCERQRERVNKRWQKTPENTTNETNTTAYRGTNGNTENTNNNINNNTNPISNIDYIADKPPRTRFYPPSVEDVEKYCRERENNVDAKRFVDYYTANGWMVGKNKMKDWKAAVRTWERNDNGETDRSSGNNSVSNRGNANQHFGLIPDVCG